MYVLISIFFFLRLTHGELEKIVYDFKQYPKEVKNNVSISKLGSHHATLQVRQYSILFFKCFICTFLLSNSTKVDTSGLLLERVNGCNCTHLSSEIPPLNFEKICG